MYIFPKLLSYFKVPIQIRESVPAPMEELNIAPTPSICNACIEQCRARKFLHWQSKGVWGQFFSHPLILAVLIRSIYQGVIDPCKMRCIVVMNPRLYFIKRVNRVFKGYLSPLKQIYPKFREVNTPTKQNHIKNSYWHPEPFFWRGLFFNIGNFSSDAVRRLVTSLKLVINIRRI